MEVVAEEKEVTEVLEEDMEVEVAAEKVVDMEEAAVAVDMAVVTAKVDLVEFQATEEVTGLGD